MIKKVLKLDRPSAGGLWIAMGPLRGPGSEGSEGSEGKVLKMDGPSAQGFLSLTAFQAEGCGIALRAMSIKSALRDLPFCVIGRNKHSADWLAALASPLSVYAGLSPQAGEE